MHLEPVLWFFSIIFVIVHLLTVFSIRLITDVYNALDISKKIQKTDSSSNNASKAVKKGKQLELDSSNNHNEDCEVCEEKVNNNGDDLLCDSCPKSFHLSCGRPVMERAPLGKWVCCYCVVDGVATNDMVTAGEARNGCLAMNRLKRGIEVEDIQTNNAKVTKSGEITIAKSGKRYVVRRTAKCQIVELDRCNTLEEALASVAAELNPAPINPKRTKFDKDVLFCSQCLDDENVSCCAFCGCRKCYGKHDSEYLLVCDGCEEEWHTQCLSPPLSDVPGTSWFCGRCVKKGKNTITTKSRSSSGSDIFDQKKSAGGRPKILIPGRGRGRPPGSNKKVKDSAASSDGESVSASSDPITTTVKERTPKSAKVAIVNTNTNANAPSAAVISFPVSLAQAMVEEVPKLGAVGIDTALSIISDQAKSNFHSTERDLLNQLRIWGPVGDLEQAKNSLAAQREAVYHKILLFDPTFSSPFMENEYDVETDALIEEDIDDNDNDDDEDNSVSVSK